MTYQGLFDLAKQFLDPFHNESFWSGIDPIRVDTIIAETNAGSVRWKDGLEHMPIPLVTIQDGGTNLDQFVLPDEGISVAETETIEQAEKVSSKVKFTESTVGSLIVVKDKEYEQLTIQDEFEETQAILRAPAGADFVPGIDDLAYEDDDCAVKDDDCEEEDSKDDPPTNVFDDYLDTLSEEYEDTMKKYESDSFMG